MNNKYDLIIFDWDGTLMDSEAKIVNCFHAAEADLGLSPAADETIRGVIGLGLKEAMQAVYPDEDDAMHQRVADAYREHFLHKDTTEMPMFPGVVEGLYALKERFTLAVATGKARRGLDRVFREVELGHLFHTTRCADETKSKPHPLMLEQILDATGTEAARALMVGDSVFDLQMATNAGIDALAVSYGVQPCDNLLAHRPVGCIHAFDEIHQWLD